MRILILSQYYPPEIGAPQTRLAAIARTLSGMGHRVEVLTGMPNYPTGRVQEGYRHRFSMRDSVEGIPVRRVWLFAAKGAGVRRLLNYLSFMATALVGALFVRRPDVVLVESPPLPLMITGRILCSAWRAQCVMYVADLWPDSAVDAQLLSPGPFVTAIRKLEQWAYARADYIVVSARAALESLMKDENVPERKLLFLPNATDPLGQVSSQDRKEARRELGLPERACIVLYAGTVGFVHGLEAAIRAMKLLESSVPRLRLLIVGDGSSLEKVMSEAADLGLGNVQFRPPVSLHELSKYWAAADIGLACQRNLPIAQKVRSAKLPTIMGAGKPVVFSGPGEGAGLIEAAEAGIVTPPEDPSALAEALRILASDSALRRRLGSKGRVFVQQNLTWERVVGDWFRELQKRRALEQEPA